MECDIRRSSAATSRQDRTCQVIHHDARLKRVIAQWGELQEPFKAAIDALVDSAQRAI